MTHLNNFDKDFFFELPTKIVYGQGALIQLPELLKTFHCQRPLIITDEGLVKAGIVAKVMAVLPTDLAVSVFAEVQANPKDSDVEAGANAYRTHTADSIIAVGGGSPIDCAKAIAVLVANDASDIRLFEGKNKPSKPLPPLLCLPTTAGTGSELTFSSVITDSERKFKMTIKNPFTAPKLALCDPELTLSVPPSVTAATGMDALTHAIEAYTATCAEPISDAMALYAIELINASLVQAYNEPENIEARSKMLMGSMLAGIAFSHSDVASVHCIAEALGGIFDLPHGLCNAVILPHQMQYNQEYCSERYARIAQILDNPEAEGPRDALWAVKAVQRLAKLVNLPSFKELNVDPALFPVIAQASVINISTQSNPRPMSETDYLELLNLMQRA